MEVAECCWMKSMDLNVAAGVVAGIYCISCGQWLDHRRSHAKDLESGKGQAFIMVTGLRISCLT